MPNNNADLNFIFINGRNGAGKDTQAEYISASIPKSVMLSTGDIYRSARSGQGEYARFYSQVNSYSDLTDRQGGLLPDDVMTSIVREIVLEKVEQGIRTFVFTGFPRTISQLNSTDAMLNGLREAYNVNASFIALAVLDEHSMDRSKLRRERAIAMGLKPRPDDKPSEVRRRLATYKRRTAPMLHKLLEEGRLIIVKGNGSKETLSQRTLELQDHIAGGNTERR